MPERGFFRRTDDEPMTHEEAIRALTEPFQNATYSGVERTRAELREWARELTKGTRAMAIEGIAVRRYGAKIRRELDRLAE